jgi:hypothetical protein
MTKATELILMFYKTLHKSMNHLTRTEVIKQETMVMSDGSTLLYNIDITLQTEQEFSIAYHKIKDASNVSFAEAMEIELRHLLFIDTDTKPKHEPCDMLTADDYPESDPEDSIGMGYGGSDFDPGEHPIHDSIG